MRLKLFVFVFCIILISFAIATTVTHTSSSDWTGTFNVTHIEGNDIILNLTYCPIDNGDGTCNATFYPDPDPETTSVDGWVRHYVADGDTWGNIRDGAGTDVRDDYTDTTLVKIKADSVNDQWEMICRGIFLFDTSILPDDSYISDGFLRLTGTGKGQTSDWSPAIGIFSANPASNTGLVAGDFDSLGTTVLTNYISYANFDVGSKGNYFNFNSDGLSAINTTGISKFGARTDYDALNITPTWEESKSSVFTIYYSEEPGGADPSIRVTFSKQYNLSGTYTSQVIDAGDNAQWDNFTWTNTSGIVKFQVHSCDDASCSGETFVGPDNTSSTYFESGFVTLNTSIAPYNQWFQYKAFFETSNSSVTPHLEEVKVGYILLDEEYPLFSNYTESPTNNTEYTPNACYEFNVTITSTNGSAILQFDGTNYSASNMTPSLFNVSICDLSAGNYLYNWSSYGNGTDANFNYSDTRDYSIAQNNSYSLSLSQTPSGSWTEIYGTQTGVLGIGCLSQISCTLFRANNSVSNPENVTLAAGTWHYVYNSSGNTNYSNLSVSNDLTINQTGIKASLSSSAGWTYDVGTSTNITFSESNAGDGDVSYDIFRDGSSVNAGELINLSAGVYSYILNTTGGQNYTSNSSMDSQTLTINQLSSSVQLYINGSRSNTTILNGTSLWLNASRVAGDENVTIYVNGTAVNSSNSANTINYYTFSAIGNHNVTAIYYNSTNYTFSSETYYIDVEGLQVTINSPTGDATPGDVTFNVSLNTIGYCLYSIDAGTTNVTMSTTDNSTFYNTSTLTAGTYTANYYCNDTIGNVNNSESITFTLSTPVSPGGGGGGGGGAAIPLQLFTIDKDLIHVVVKQKETERETLTIKNTGSSVLNVTINSTELSRYLIISEESFVLKKGESKTVNVDFFAREEEIPEIYTGRIYVKGGNVKKVINVIIEVKERKPLFDLRVDVFNKRVIPGSKIKFDILAINQGDLRGFDILLHYSIRDFEGEIYEMKEESIKIDGELELTRELIVPSNLALGKYVLYSKISYQNITATGIDTFEVMSREALQKYRLMVSAIVVLIILILIVLVSIILLSEK